MRIALDIDGLLDEHPTFFSFLSTALKAQGHTVLHSSRLGGGTRRAAPIARGRVGTTVTGVPPDAARDVPSRRPENDRGAARLESHRQPRRFG